MKFDLEKRARELFSYARNVFGHSSVVETLALQLAREALAAQAEEIAERCIQCSRAVGTGIYWDGYRMCGSRLASDALSLISKPWPKKTREQELEETLWTATRNMKCYCQVDAPCIRCRARRLLEKKP